jgi:hypothetical protein
MDGMADKDAILKILIKYLYTKNVDMRCAPSTTRIRALININFDNFTYVTFGDTRKQS